VLKENKPLTTEIVSSTSYQLNSALAAPKLKSNPHPIYGNDIVIGYNALRLMIGYERNQTGATLLSAGDDEFVIVSTENDVVITLNYAKKNKSFFCIIFA